MISIDAENTTNGVNQFETEDVQTKLREKLIVNGVPIERIDTVLDTVSEIVSRTGFLDTATLEEFLNYFKGYRTAEPDAVSRTKMCIEALKNEFKHVYNSVDDLPEFTNEIPKLDIKVLGIPDTNLIMKFHRYAIGITDSYEEYVIQNSFSMLGTISQRRIYALLNGRQIFTNLWIRYSGLSGYARKSASMSLAKKRVTNACGNLYLREDVNPASLLETMATEIREEKTDKEGSRVVSRNLTIVDEKHNIMRSQRCLCKDEFGQLLAQLNKTTHLGFKELLLRLHSCETYTKDNVGKNTLVKDPFLSMLWATTDETMKKYFTQEDIGSGLLARTLFVNPTYQKDRKPMTEGDSESPENVRLANEIEADLALIDRVLRNSVSDLPAENKSIRVFFETGVLEILEAWVAEREKYYAYKHDELMSAFVPRFQENAVRLAIAIELGNIPELILPDILKGKVGEFKITEFKISKAAMEASLKLIDLMYLPYAVKLALELKVDLSTTAQSGISKDLDRIERQLEKNLKMDFRVCMRNCSLKKDNFKECVESLVYTGAVLQAKVVVSQNKLQHWLIHVPPERRNAIFENEYSNVTVSPYVSSIIFSEYLGVNISNMLNIPEGALKVNPDEIAEGIDVWEDTDSDAVLVENSDW